jgi:hypothetical protein
LALPHPANYGTEKGHEQGRRNEMAFQNFFLGTNFTRKKKKKKKEIALVNLYMAPGALQGHFLTSNLQTMARLYKANCTLRGLDLVLWHVAGTE